tara:strand:+ start:182 stop:322 length:141 start_codon:yes stop_codon:yes gene_type:complete
MLIFSAVNVVSIANDLLRLGSSGLLTTVMMLSERQALELADFWGEV